jgi:hypothetical protein
MKKRTIIIAIILSLISFSSLFAEESKKFLSKNPIEYKSLQFDGEQFSLILQSPKRHYSSTGLLIPKANSIFTIEYDSLKEEGFLAPFNKKIWNSGLYFLNAPFEIEKARKNKKKHLKSALEIISLNLTVWAFDRYIMKESWAYVSLTSWWDNLKSGFEWDKDTIWTNHIGHPYHGVIHYSIARSNNLSIPESALFSLFGSFHWEVFLETRGDLDNPPSINDLMLNPLGGILLGELLLKASDLVIDESSVGFERVLRESLAVLVNPANIFGRVISGDAFKVGNPPDRHYFDLKIPFGAYSLTTGKLTYLLSFDLEYKDYLKNSRSSLRPYEWFSLHARLGFQGNAFPDKEVISTGIFLGKKIKNGLAGLFGVFDYIDSQASNGMAAMGFGPGFVKRTEFDSNYYINSSAILSLIIGGATPSIPSPKARFGTKIDMPYYFGPGLLGRLQFEFGKNGLGNINASIAQYWVHSIYSAINEFQNILSLRVNFDMSKKSQIGIGYDHNWRHAFLKDERVNENNHALRALYILKF